jgi:hypothetical protein
MLRVKVLCLAICCTAMVPAIARGQDAMVEEEHGIAGPLVWNLGGQLTVPIGDTSNRTDVGGGLAVGLTYNLAAATGVQFEYGVNWSSLKTPNGLSALGIAGNGLLQYFNLNLLVRPFHLGSIGFYLIGGGGLYYRRADITRVNGTALATYCDPWFFYCSAVPVSAQSVVGSRSRWDWGVDGGIGFTLPVAQTTRLYLEARYHYVWGPTFTSASGATAHANGQFLPITFGVRF